MNIFRITITVSLLLCATAAQADWATAGVATKCDSASRTYEITQTVSSSDVEGNVYPESGFTELPHGNHDLRCQLGADVVTVNIRVIPPRPKGMCMGAGFVSIERFSVNRKIIMGQTAFNWLCPGHRTPIGITIRTQGTTVLVETCTSNFRDWEPETSRIQCTSQAFTR